MHVPTASGNIVQSPKERHPGSYVGPATHPEALRLLLCRALWPPSQGNDVHPAAGKLWSTLSKHAGIGVQVVMQRATPVCSGNAGTSLSNASVPNDAHGLASAAQQHGTW